MLKCHFFLLWFKYFTLNKKIIRYSQHISCSNKRLGPGSVCLLTFCIGSFIKSICFSFPLLPAPSTKAPPANHLLQITATGPYLHRLPTPWLPTNPYPPPPAGRRPHFYHALADPMVSVARLSVSAPQVHGQRLADLITASGHTGSAPVNMHAALHLLPLVLLRPPTTTPTPIYPRSSPQSLPGTKLQASLCATSPRSRQPCPPGESTTLSLPLGLSVFTHAAQ